jgi:Oxidoreductase molybdopterin binding domain
MNLDRFDHPLRLAKGSHRPESGKGCAMNVVSYINGDSEITDFPACSARPLAAFVQSCNDLLAGPDGYLSPENSLLALELAWQTVGTADVADIVIHAWVAELLASPRWGVVRYAKNAAVEAIFDIAELHRKAASGDMPPIAAWDAAQRAAGAAARAIDPTSDAGGLHPVRAAHQSTAIIDTDHWVKLDAVTGHALRAHELVAGEGAATHIVALTRRAIRSWRHLAGLANPSQASPRQADHVARSAAGLQMNFELLPRVHGGPVRVVVPGYVGARSVKVIEVLRHCSKGPAAQRILQHLTNTPAGVDKPRLSRVQGWVLDAAVGVAEREGIEHNHQPVLGDKAL